jgi:hypothetical protein
MKQQVIISQQGENVALVVNGQLIFEIDWKNALEFAEAVRAQAKKAEEQANVVKLIRDQAVLTRAGVPFGLTSNRAILEEAVKEAYSNRDLRRYMPGGVKATAVIGTPTVIQHKGKK